MDLSGKADYFHGMDVLANLAPAIGGLIAALVGYLYARRVHDRAQRARAADRLPRAAE
ncbi:hypothetical protein SCH01S_52_01090 [Sphingomonas changbaiensis NBRC 104936]|uniref:Uncharacterized protein n=1 Tax=Sphingomonas changbaiensis NBRC 104936 TaxID=1219043 RepID=A0A0E9MU40_9SPHN|nr:hypothetical protein [Sphingomonas changbaiensis]GAO40926.1 hypothetical protein SCH01S_52_01090 [Sphingomonas changbaiensis NBRC 104936]